MPQRPQPSLRLADGGNFITRWAQNVMRPGNTDKRLREIEAPPPAPVVRPAPPPPPPNATPDNPAGIRFQDGGGLSKDAVMEAIARQRAAAAGSQSGGGSGTAPQTQPQPQQPSMMRDFLRNPGSVLRERERAVGLRFQDGGVVPGTGTGDKIPAKYEPGEFVVSNDMIDDNPGLREQLSGLRAETLAARGKTVEEADAKALRYHGDDTEGARHAQVSLRAADGFDPFGRMARDLTGQNSLPPKSPVGNMADDLTRNARTAPPPPQPGPNNPGMANPQARAAYAEMARGSAPTAPAVGPPSTYNTGLRAGQAAGAAKDWAFGSRPAATTVLGGMKNKVGAGLTAAGRVAGVAAAGDSFARNVEGMSNVFHHPNSTFSDNAAAAVEGAGNIIGTGVASLGSKFPVIGPMIAGAIGPNPASMLADTTDDSVLNKFNPGAGFGRTRVAQMVSPAPGSGVAPTAASKPDLRNPYASVTPEQGRAMAEVHRGAAAGQPQAPQEAPFDFDTFEPRSGEGAFRNEQTGKVTRLQNTPGGQAWQAVPSRQTAATPMPQQRREVRAPTLRTDGGVFAAMTDFANQAGQTMQDIAYNKGLRNDRRDALEAGTALAKLDQGDRGLDIQANDLEMRRAGQTAMARAKQQELAYNQQRDALRDAMDIEKHVQTVGHNATSNARDRLKGMAVRDDGKGGSVVDEGRLARLESTLAKMSPGWAQSGEATQAKLLRKAEASVNILEGLNSQRNNGWFQAFGIDGKSAQLDNLPHKEMKGARLNEVDFVDGVTTPGTGRNDYVIETSGGRKMYLPRSSVNQGELELLKSLGVDITGIEK